MKYLNILCLALAMSACQNFTAADIQRLAEIANQIRQSSGK